MLFHLVKVPLLTFTHVHAHKCKAKSLKGVAGLSHPTSGLLVKESLPPVCSSPDIKHVLRGQKQNLSAAVFFVDLSPPIKLSL